MLAFLSTLRLSFSQPEVLQSGDYFLCLLSSDTESFFLPFALLLVITALPLTLSILERKPCLFLLFLFGSYPESCGSTTPAVDLVRPRSDGSDAIAHLTGLNGRKSCSTREILGRQYVGTRSPFYHILFHMLICAVEMRM